MFTLQIETGNAAFGEGDGPHAVLERGAETARILRNLANYVEGGRTGDGPLHDSNGNRVGHFILTDD